MKVRSQYLLLDRFITFDLKFSVEGNANGSVIYSVIDNNGNSFLTTPAGSHIYATNSSYSEFITQSSSSLLE